MEQKYAYIFGKKAKGDDYYRYWISMSTEKVGKNGLSVRQAEALVQREKTRAPAGPKGPSGAFPLPEALRQCSKEKGFSLAARRKPSGVAVTLGDLTERQAARLLDLVLVASGDVFREEGD